MGVAPPHAPFVVFALPRSRTAWLALFLGHGPYACAHDQAAHVRSMEDVTSWLAQDRTGTIETAVARWWRLLPLLRPDVRVATIRRPIEEVVASLGRLDMGELGRFEPDRLRATLCKQDAALDALERGLPGVMRVSFDDLSQEATCAALYHHLVGIPPPAGHWAAAAPVNVQVDMQSVMRHFAAHRPQLLHASRLASRAVAQARLNGRRRPIEIGADGVEIGIDTFAAFWRDGESLFAEHCLAVGEPPDQYLRKNIPVIQSMDRLGAIQVLTARQHGMMLGYLVSVISPSLEGNWTVAVQTTFFVTGRARGMNLGFRLQRASIAVARRRGIREVMFRAGPRGSGPKMGALYRRLGALPYGELYQLVLRPED